MSKRSILASLRERERTLPHVLTDVMSKDVDCTADKVHRFQQKSDEVQTAKEEEEEDQDSNDQNVKLLAMEELVPISQSLITPSLARLFNLNLPPPQQPFVEGVMPAERSQYDAALTSKEELQLMQLQEGFHSSRAGEEDSRLSADDPCLQIMMDPFVDPDMSGATVGHKRSHLNAGLEGFNMQLGDGNNDLAESYGMHPLLERENSSNSAEGAGSGGGGNGGGGSARTLKRPRLVWTPQLHKRFVDAVSHLGIKNAVPKTIMQLMNVDGLTRENVASHLQKYRLYLRRVHQGNLFSSCANSSNRSMLGGLEHHHLIGAPLSPARSSDHLFSSSSTPSISMASSSHVHHHQPPGHINPLIPSHMQSLLMQQPQHQLNQAMSMIKSPPLHFNPHRFVPNTSDSPTQRSPWPSRHSSFSDINVLCHGSKGPPSPPRQALTLFPH